MLLSFLAHQSGARLVTMRRSRTRCDTLAYYTFRLAELPATPPGSKVDKVREWSLIRLG
jgi:hypothetical protein